MKFFIVALACTLFVQSLMILMNAIWEPYPQIQRKAYFRSLISLRNERTSNACPPRYGRGAIVIVAHSSVQNEYRVAIRSMRCYALKHNYSFYLLDFTAFYRQCTAYRHMMFRRHCIVLEILKQFAWVAAFDADVGVADAGKCMESLMSDGVDVVHEERFHNGEVQAGGYIIKNSEFGRRYLTQWMNYETQLSLKFDNADNGALHMHLLRYWAGNDTGVIDKCDSLWKAATDLQSYDEFVGCVMSYISNPAMHSKVGVNIRLVRRGHGFVRDLWVTDVDSKHYISPVDFFLHAMKKQVDFYDEGEDFCGRAYYEPLINPNKILNSTQMIPVIAQADIVASQARPLSITKHALVGNCWPHCKEY